MKKLFLILFSIPAVCFGQQGFHIGAFGNNGAFWLYNYSDFHAANPTLCVTNAPDAFKFQNFKTGISTGYGISEKCAINCNLLFSNYYQEYKRASGVKRIKKIIPKRQSERTN